MDIADLERDVDRVHRDIADYIGELIVAAEQGILIGSNLSVDQLRALQASVLFIETEQDLRTVLTPTLQGEFEDPNLAFEIAITQLIEAGVAAELVDIFDANVFGQVSGAEAVRVQVVADILAGVTVEGANLLADQIGEQFGELVRAARDLNVNTLEDSFIRGLEPVRNRLFEYFEANPDDNPEIGAIAYSDILIGTYDLLSFFGLQVLDRIANPLGNLISFLNEDIVRDQIREGYDQSADFVRLNIDTISLEFLSEPEIVQSYLTGIEEFLFDQLVLDFGLTTGNLGVITARSAELIPTLSNVVLSARTNEANSLKTTSEFGLAFGGGLAIGGAGDTVRGSSEADILFGGLSLEGNQGNDLLVLSASVEQGVAEGEAGDDIIFGSNGSDQRLSGGTGFDQIFGNDGSDSLFGDGGEDVLNGGDGVDFLFGGANADQLFGGEGGDLLNGGGGGDIIDGGEGFDFADYRMSSGRTVFSYDAASQTLTGSTSESNGDVLSNVEAILGGALNDRVEGLDIDAGEFFLPDGTPLPGFTFDGGGGRDLMEVSDGVYSFSGGSGQDTLIVDRTLISGPNVAQNFIFFTGGTEIDTIRLEGFDPNNDDIPPNFVGQNTFVEVLDSDPNDRLFVGNFRAGVSADETEWRARTDQNGERSFQLLERDTGFVYTVVEDASGSLQLIVQDGVRSEDQIPPSFVVRISDFQSGDYGVFTPDFSPGVPAPQQQIENGLLFANHILVDNSPQPFSDAEIAPRLAEKPSENGDVHLPPNVPEPSLSSIVSDLDMFDFSRITTEKSALIRDFASHEPLLDELAFIKQTSDEIASALIDQSPADQDVMPLLWTHDQADEFIYEVA